LKAAESQIPPANRKAMVLSAGQRLLQLYETWGRPEESAAWRVKLGLADLPEDVFAPP
jgi:hypothetical protein